MLLRIAGGLSPHGRGKRLQRRRRRICLRSIPARAGETLPFLEPCNALEVYPRTGGGNIIVDAKTHTLNGLSPHGRGKQQCHRPETATAGSIPARAGETQTQRFAELQEVVYPRTGGGNVSGEVRQFFDGGLSPHGRGKPGMPSTTRKTWRSIPARAGETPACPPAKWHSRVYPRTGGGN